MQERLLIFLIGFLLATTLWMGLFPSFEREFSAAVADAIAANAPVATHDVPQEISSSMNSF